MTISPRRQLDQLLEGLGVGRETDLYEEAVEGDRLFVAAITWSDGEARDLRAITDGRPS